MLLTLYQLFIDKQNPSPYNFTEKKGFLIKRVLYDFYERRRHPLKD